LNKSLRSTVFFACSSAGSWSDFSSMISSTSSSKTSTGSSSFSMSSFFKSSGFLFLSSVIYILLVELLFQLFLHIIYDRHYFLIVQSSRSNQIDGANIFIIDLVTGRDDSEILCLW